MTRFLLPLVVLAGLVALLAVGLRLDPAHVPSPLIGQPLPDFETGLVQGEGQLDTQTLSARGPLLLNVWASWCAACRDEHPLLMELAPHLPIYGLNWKDERASARGWLGRFGDPYRASLHDPAGRIGIDLGVYGVPETFLIDAGGVIRYKHVGPLTGAVLEQEILPRWRELTQAPTS